MRNQFLLLLGIAVFGSLPVYGSTAGGQLFNVERPRPSFEVSTIKPSKPDEQPNIYWSAALFRASHQSVRQLVRIAYAVKDASQLAGGPSWIDQEFFDIEAKPEQSQTQALRTAGSAVMLEQTRLMLQSLLQDRFGLRVSDGTRLLPVFALKAIKSSPKMKKVAVRPEIAQSPTSPIPPPPPPPVDGAAPKLLQPPADFPRLYNSGPNQLTVVAYRMTWFADWLSHQSEIDRPVLDETGLDGNFNFVLDGIALSPKPVEPPVSDNSTTSLFVALPEQLGLKLESTKAPMPVLIIDHVERPSEN